MSETNTPMDWKSDKMYRVEPPHPWPAPPPRNTPQPEVAEAIILRSPSTPVMCTGCKTSDASTYYLKRERGLYALLCFRGGTGCWEHSAKTMCSHVDSETSAQCDRMAEYTVVSLDGRSSRITCLPCLPFMMASAVPGVQVFPID